jgi:tRNA(Ile)-lysidine synthase
MGEPQSSVTLERRVTRALPQSGSVILAVSGGLDSMVLLDLAATVGRRRRCVLMVATFDHASGTHSSRAAAFVARSALDYGMPVVVGRADHVVRSEAAWRAARWQFLRSIAAGTHARIVTAHTRDDQVETVLMRAMREAGARGLAGLRAPSDVLRPLIDVRRTDLEAYAKARGLTWIDDPTNLRSAYLRNRIRRDLLPALVRARPDFDAELIEVGERAAAWRRDLAAMVERMVPFDVNQRENGARQLDVSAEELMKYSSASLRIILPELASRAGVTLDRRGTQRAAELIESGRVGRRIQLSGGWELIRSRTQFELRATTATEASQETIRPLAPPMTWDRWAFAQVESTSSRDAWCFAIPSVNALSIRAWRPGDKLTIRQGERLVARKVKYFLSDAGISGHIRARWPVVLAGNEIVWIPGVRRSDAATVRSGGPVVMYACDYLDRRS